MPSGLGYRIETAPSSTLLLRVNDEDRPPVLVWDDEAVLDDMSLALDRGSVQERTATEATVAVLIQLFANNSDEKMLSREVRRQLQEAGVSTSGSVMDAAKKQLGIKSWQRSLGEPWYLLPPKRRVGISGISGIYARAGAHVPHTSDTGDGGDTGDTGDCPVSSIVPHNPAESPPSDPSHARARESDTRYCLSCRRLFAGDVEHDQHLPCQGEVLPPGLCPVHRKLFSLHDCDAL
jgi:hypothetical protein